MALSNTDTPRYYSEFRKTVLSGKCPVCKEISLQMNRIDELIRNPKYYYDDEAVEGFILFERGQISVSFKKFTPNNNEKMYKLDFIIPTRGPEELNTFAENLIKLSKDIRENPDKYKSANLQQKLDKAKEKAKKKES